MLLSAWVVHKPNSNWQLSSALLFFTCFIPPNFCKEKDNKLRRSKALKYHSWIQPGYMFIKIGMNAATKHSQGTCLSFFCISDKQICLMRLWNNKKMLWHNQKRALLFRFFFQMTRRQINTQTLLCSFPPAENHITLKTVTAFPFLKVT